MPDLHALNDIAAAAAERHGDDVQQAITEAEEAIRALPEYRSLVNGLVRQAISDMVYAARHAANVRMRKEAGDYGNAGRVNPAQSSAVQEVCQSLYEYYIGGRTLGSLRGDDLASIAQQETAVAEGHLFNARLCQTLARKVKAGETVQDSVPERELKRLFKRLRKEVREAA